MSFSASCSWNPIFSPKVTQKTLHLSDGPPFDKTFQYLPLPVILWIIWIVFQIIIYCRSLKVSQINWWVPTRRSTIYSWGNHLWALLSFIHLYILSYLRPKIYSDWIQICDPLERARAGKPSVSYQHSSIPHSLLASCNFFSSACAFSCQVAHLTSNRCNKLDSGAEATEIHCNTGYAYYMKLTMYDDVTYYVHSN